jgi:hypothetical protein
MSKGCDHCLHPLWAGIRCGVCGRWADENGDPSEKLEAAWDAYKKALKEFDCPRCGHNCSQSEQEPAAWRSQNATPPGGFVIFQQYPQGLADLGGKIEPLFTHPPRREWQGLTDEEIHNLPQYQETREMYRFARAIEAALKEKNK